MGFGGSVYCQKKLEKFDLRGMVGAMYVKLKVDGENDIVSKPLQSLSYSENSGNLYLGIEARKKYFNEWYIAPAFSLIDTGDQIQLISLKVSRDLGK